MKKRFQALFLTGVILLFGAIGLLYKNYSVQVLTQESIEFGNTSGNIVNGGFAAEKDGWIYYSNHSDGYKLYKKSADGRENIKLAEENVSFINVIGEFIIYCSNSDSEKIYRIKKDGSERKALAEERASNIIVVGNLIYYINISDESRIYKISIDGKGKSRIADESVDGMNVSNEYLFYTAKDREGIYRIKTDGREKTLLTKDKADYVNVDGQWLYYKNMSDRFSLYKIKTDGTERTRVHGAVVENINVKGQWIYYLNDGINRVKTDGTGYEKVLKDNCGALNTGDNWIFFKKGISSLYQIKSDGSKWSNFEGVTEAETYEDIYIAKKSGTDFIINDPKFKEEYEKTEEVIKRIIKPGMTELEKEMAVHDYLVTNTRYDEADYDAIVSKKGNINVDSHRVYGILVKGLGVCEGYAEAAKVLLNMCGIECHIVYGRGKDSGEGVGHAWNLVKIDGEYYQLDITWDDPVPDQGSRISYRYFNLTDDEMSQDHEYLIDETKKSENQKFNYLRTIYCGVRNGDWIIYTGEKKDDFNLYKIKTDGSGKTKLNSDRSAFIDTDGVWIFYSNYSEGGYLYKIKNDGSSRTRINSEWSRDISLEGEYLYYTNGNNNIRYKVMKNGSNKQKADKN